MNNSPSYIMNKKLLALEISGAVFGTQAVAVELYNEDGTTFSVAVGDLNSDDRLGSDDIGVESVSPRINFGATHELDNGFTADAKGEWALNILDGAEGLYLAGVYAMNNYMNSGNNQILEESVAIELLASYALSNSLNLSVNYEVIEDDKKSETVFSTTALQAEYNFTSQFVGFAGYQFDLQGSGVYKEKLTTNG